MELEAQEHRELTAAIKAHGGEYVFFDCNKDDVDDKWNEANDADDMPIVTGYHQLMDKADRFYITRVSLDESGNPVIFGFRSDYGRPSDEDMLYNIQFGYIEDIIREIPETEGVHDVRELPKLNSMPVLTLSREDLWYRGYDPNIPDDKFMALGESVSKYLNYDDFWGSLEYACGHHEIPLLKEQNDEK